MPVSRDPEDWADANDGGVTDNKRKTQYVARIIGESEQYGLDREFISKEESASYSGKTRRKWIDTDDIAVGDVLEIRGDSWGNKKRRLVVIDDITRHDDGVEIESTKLDGDDEALQHVEQSIGRVEKRRTIKRVADSLTDEALDTLHDEAMRLHE